MEGVSVEGTTILMKFEFLSFLEKYIKTTYYGINSTTMFFQLEFVKVICSLEIIRKVKTSLKKRRILGRKKKNIQTT